MKLFLTDIDGSLLPFGQHELSPTLVSFFRELSHEDVRVTFATGKPFERLVPLAKALNVTTPLICANGALIKDPTSGATLLREPIPEDAVREIIDVFAHDLRCQLYPETDQRLFFVDNPKIPEGSWRHNRPGWIPPKAYHVDEPLNAMGELPHKMAVSVKPEDRETVETELQARFGDRLNIFHPKPDMIDLTPKSVDKGTAAAWLAGHLGVKKEDTIALGDELNDLPLFEAVSYSLARDHAPVALLERADEVVGSTDEALILALKRIFKLEK